MTNEHPARDERLDARRASNSEVAGSSPATGALPRAVYSSKLNIGGVELKCHVLDNGERVFEAGSFEAFMLALLGGPTPSREDIDAIARFVHGKESQ